MTRNTRFKKLVFYVPIVISGFFTLIGVIADLFGVASGIGEHKDTILGLIFSILSFLALWWKWALAITVSFVVIIIFIKLYLKRKIEDRRTRGLSWFDAERRNTKFSGRNEYLDKLKQFLKQDDKGILWWAVTGVAGIGKTRLVIEALENSAFSNADVQWIKSFDDYRENALKERVDAILKQPNFRNIIIAEDAQIYMDNIGILIEYIAGKSVYEIGDHKIRVLMLIRTGEYENLKERYKQLESKSRKSILRRTQFNTFGKELRMEKYEEKDIAEVIKSYAVKTKKMRNEKALTDKQIADLQTKAIKTLKSEKVDPKHLRPLFAMFITDALLSGKNPMSWDFRNVLEYAVAEREEEFLRLATRHIQRNYSFRVYDKIRGIISLSIIRGGITLTDLVGLKEDLAEELGQSGIILKDFLKDMQLMGYDEMIRMDMPDILSEYYVLRTLVIEPDENTVDWIIESLCNSLIGADVLRQKIRQDYRYLYDVIEKELNAFYSLFFERCSRKMAYAIINEIISKPDLRDSNAIIFHKAFSNLIRNKSDSKMLAKDILHLMSRLNESEEKRECLEELKQLAQNGEKDAEVVYIYCWGILLMIESSSEMEDKQRHLLELRRLSESNDDERIIGLESFALNRMVEAAPQIEEKRKYLSELEDLSEGSNNDTVIAVLCKSLACMIHDAPEIEKKREYLTKLEYYFGVYNTNENIASKYAEGLSYIISSDSEMDKKYKYLSELKRFSEIYNENHNFAYYYSLGLISMIFVTINKQERIEYQTELKSLSDQHKENDRRLIISYGMGLAALIITASEMEEKYEKLSELKEFSEIHTKEVVIAHLYGQGLCDMMEQDLGINEKTVYLYEMKRLSDSHDDDSDIALIYCQGLRYMLGQVSEIEEKRKLFFEIKRLFEINEECTSIFYLYLGIVFDMRHIDPDNFEYYYNEFDRLLNINLDIQDAE